MDTVKTKSLYMISIITIIMLSKRSRSKTKKNKTKAISPIIATILLVVIAVILVSAILSFGESYTRQGLDKTKIINEQSVISSSIVAKSIGTNRADSHVMSIKDISSTESTEIVGYRFLDSKTRYSLINNEQFNLSTPVTVTPGSTNLIPLRCTPSSEFEVQLITSDDKYIPIKYKNNQYNPISCAIKQVSSGNSHTCAVLYSGEVKCWGYNYNGQLGDGTTTNRLTPVLVSGITNAINVSSGGFHTCATLSTGEIKCWGDNDYGQLGDGTTTDRLTPVLVSGLQML